MNPALSVKEILAELVAIPTPSTASNLPLLHWVMAFLEQHRWTCELLPYKDQNDVQKANLIACPIDHEFKQPTDLAFVCHTDTVPLAAGWTRATTLEQRDDQLHGCGSCDVKGALACFLAALASTKTVRKSVALILTADEEIGCKGMDQLLLSSAFTGLQIRTAIISEPTSLRAGIAGKGYGLARVTIIGREAHSAFPQQGVSAISIAARLVQKIEEYCAEEPTISSEAELFDPPRMTLNIGTIEGGTAKNIVAGRCTFLVEWRPLPGQDPTVVYAHLLTLAERAQAKNRPSSVSVELLRAEAGFAPSAIGHLQQRITETLGTKPIGISFGSEAGRVARLAEELIVIGPGDMRYAHSDREFVPISELDRWTHVLQNLLTEVV